MDLVGFIIRIFVLLHRRAGIDYGVSIQPSTVTLPRHRTEHCHHRLYTYYSASMDMESYTSNFKIVLW